MLSKIYNEFNIFAHKYFRSYCAKISSNEQFSFFKMHNIKHYKLNKFQKKEVKKTWGKEANYKTHEIILSVTGKFDKNICPENIYRVYLDTMFNNWNNTHSWDDKNYFDRFVSDTIFPYTVIRNINGRFFDHEYNIISSDKAKEILLNGKKYIIKPSKASGVGRGVKLITDKDDYGKIFNHYNKDFIIQEVLEQHSIMQKFSNESINIMRIFTLRLNNKIYFISAMLRAGLDGGITDNKITKDGRGMFCIGIDNNGYLKKYGVYCSGEIKSEIFSGMKFEGIQIPNFKSAVELVCKAHERLELFDFIGWDVVIQKDGKPLIMEYNLKGPGILAQQMLNGPLFGKYTDEVIKLYNKNKKNIWKE